MTEKIDYKNIKDEMDFYPIQKNAATDYCWGCGPVGDKQEVGEQRYMLGTNYTDLEGRPDYEYLEFCPKHFAFWLNLALTHLLKVEKGKEKGPLTLHLVQQMQKVS